MYRYDAIWCDIFVVFYGFFIRVRLLDFFSCSLKKIFACDWNAQKSVTELCLQIYLPGEESVIASQIHGYISQIKSLSTFWSNNSQRFFKFQMLICFAVDWSRIPCAICLAMGQNS